MKLTALWRQMNRSATLPMLPKMILETAENLVAAPPSFFEDIPKTVAIVTHEKSPVIKARQSPMNYIHSCPLCSTGELSTLELSTHMSWMHTSHGVRQTEFSKYSTRVLLEVGKRVPRVTRTLVIDYANVELSSFNGDGNEKSGMLTDLHDPRVVEFFTKTPVNIVCVFEIFMRPSTTKTTIDFGKLAKLNPLSKLFTIYAGCRAENGDFVAAAVMNKLLQVPGGGMSSKIVLVSKDQRQRAACTQMASPACVSIPATTALALIEALASPCIP